MYSRLRLAESLDLRGPLRSDLVRKRLRIIQRTFNEVFWPIVIICRLFDRTSFFENVEHFPNSNAVTYDERLAAADVVSKTNPRKFDLARLFGDIQAGER